MADSVMQACAYKGYLALRKIKSDFETTIQDHRVFAKSTDKQQLKGVSSTSCVVNVE